jgi:hypothetical protein
MMVNRTPDADFGRWVLLGFEAVVKKEATRNTVYPHSHTADNACV